MTAIFKHEEALLDESCGTKVCVKCEHVYSLSAFYFRKDSGKYRNECRHCRNKYNLNLYHTNSKQKENHRKASWKHNIKKNYGITPEDYYDMLDEQEGKCKICSTHIDDIDKHVLYVDHDHNTGNVRGLLCQQCNTGLGMFRDRQDLLLKAKEYLDDSII